MKATYTFSHYEIMDMIRAHLKKEGLLHDNKQASVSFRMVNKNGEGAQLAEIVAVSEVSDASPVNSGYMDR